MDSHYPYTRRIANRARVPRQAAAAVILGLAACTLGYALVSMPAPPRAELAVAAVLLKDTRPVANQAARAQAPRRVYPYSIVPGGVSGQTELKRVIRRDKVVAAHYATFDVDKAHAVTVNKPRAVHVSYRKGDQVYWTAKKVMLAQGETLLSDGDNEMRARCANRISDLPQFPVEAQEPSAEVLDSVVEQEADDLAGVTGDAAAGIPGGAMPRHAGRGMQARPSAGGARIAGDGPAAAATGTGNAGMDSMTLSGSSSRLASIPRSSTTAPVTPGSPPPALEVSPPGPDHAAPGDAAGAVPGGAGLPPVAGQVPGAPGGGAGSAQPVPVTPPGATPIAPPARPPVTRPRPPAGGGTIGLPPSGGLIPGAGDSGGGSSGGGGSTEGVPVSPLPGESGPKPGPFIPEPTLVPPVPPASTGEGKPDGAEVPEPSSAWLVAAALAGMALLRRRRPR